MQVDAADILLIDVDGQTLAYRAGRGFRTQAIEDSHVSLGESYAGRVAKERRLIQVPDLREKSQPSHLVRPTADEGFITYMAVPLIVKGKVTGMFFGRHKN